MSYTLVVFAVPPMGGYTPGATLDPDCAPLDTDCTVAVEILTFDSPLTKTGSVISLPAASATVDGYLSATDYNAFADKEDSFGAGVVTDYLRGDKTWATLDTSVVPENGNLYWTNNRFDTRLAATTSIPNLQTVGTITSGIWHGSQIMDAYVSDSITVSNYIPLSQRGAANGVATLDGSGKITASQLSSFSLSDTFVVNSELEMVGLLSAELGDVAIRLDENKSYILTTNDPTNVANWQQIITPLDFILSVNGQTGAVNLTTTDIPEGLNLYYTDSRVNDYLNTVKGVANGVASLDANGKIPTNQLGSIILNETHVVADIPEMLTLTGAVNGDLAVVTSTSETYVLADDNDPSNINSWVEIVNGAPVTSVNGQVGTVNLTTTNISEGSNQYFTNTRARGALSATGPLSYNSTTGVFGITQANSTTNGFLSATDWNTFNNKQSALTFGNVTASSNPEITITGGTGAVIGTGLNITIPDASDTVRGLITIGAQNFGGVKNFIDGLGVGDSSPSELFSVGSGGLFQVDSSGDLVKIKNIAYTWPGTQGAADSVLVNDGSGGLSWASNGVTSLNGLTDTTQTFTTSTTGTDFSISSSAGVHTFNFPTASATARGALSTTKYTEFNNKPFVDTTYNNIYVGSISAGSIINGAGGGINNIVMGYQSGDTLSTGNNNTLLGYQSGKNITTGVSHAFFTGYQAGLSATSATNSIFIGRQAGSGATSASFANFQGRSAGLNATGAQYGIFIGDNAGNTASGSSNATFIGQNAGYQATTAPYSTFIGTSAGYQATGATTATFIGYAAGYTASDADYANMIGRGAGNAATNAQYSNFFGFQAGYNATNAANSIFIGKNAGNADTVNNTVSGSSIAIGDSAGTGGFSNSIAIGASAVNTATNQFLIGSSYTNFNVRGINYVWPSAQAAGSGYTLTNDGSGNLSWATGLSIGGSSGQLQYNNAGSLAGVSGVSYNGANLDVNDATFRIVNYGDTTKRAIFDVGYIDPATTRTFTFPNYGGTFALATGVSGGQTIYGGTLASNNLTLSSTTNATKGKILFGTSAYDEVNNRLGIGTITPTALLQLAAGTATASTAPLKFTAGTNLTTPEAGAVEYTTNNWWFSPSTSNRIRFGYGGSGSAGISNLAIGVNSGTNLTTGSGNNTYIGLNTGGSQTNGLGNTGIGAGALYFHTGYTANTAVGEAAMYYGSGSGNVAMGDYAMFADSGVNTTTGAVSIGNNSFYKKSAGNYGIAIGYNAGLTVSTAANSIIIGYNAVNGGVHTGTNTIAIGEEAGKILTSGTYNNLIGYQAGATVTTGTHNNFIGYQAGYNTSSSTGSANFIGYQAGYGTSTAAGTSNFIGWKAGYGATYAIQNNFFGSEAGYGAGNITEANFIGTSSGYNAANASYAVFIGNSAGHTATNAVSTIAIGQNAGRNATGAVESIFLGKNAGYNSVSTGITGDYNIGLGTETGKALTTGTYNVFLGYQAGRNITSNTGNFMAGYQAGYNNDNSYNNFIGYTAGYGAVTVQQSNFLGPNAGTNATFGSYSNFFGPNAGSGATYGSYSNYFGNAAGLNATNATSSNFFGNNAGNTATNATLSNFIGSGAGYQATNASYANFFGSDAGRSAAGAIDSIFIGQSAGRNATGAVESIFLGKNAGYNSVSTGITGDYNIGLGTSAASALTTGAYNILLGYQAGDAITTGSNNIIIGKDIDAQSATTDNQLSIQNIIFGTGNSGTGTTVSTGKIGIGTASPSYRFSVSDTTTAGIVGSFTNSDGTCTLDPGDVSGWSCPSDLNLKKDIETLTSGSLDNILALRPVTYRLINEDGSANLSTGLIAQEVQTIFPKLVKTQIDGTLALNYGGLTPYMISAIQEMNLNVTEIGLVEKPNSWRDALIAWFANTANGITEFFSKKVSTEELCVTDSAGQTCITRTQLDALLNGQGIVPPLPGPTPDPENGDGSGNETDPGNSGDTGDETGDPNIGDSGGSGDTGSGDPGNTGDPGDTGGDTGGGGDPAPSPDPGV